MLRTYKLKNKIIGYIRASGNGFRFCTGKPSDAFCLSWYYTNFTDAEATAAEYVQNYANK